MADETPIPQYSGWSKRRRYSAKKAENRDAIRAARAALIRGDASAPDPEPQKSPQEPAPAPDAPSPSPEAPKAAQPAAQAPGGAVTPPWADGPKAPADMSREELEAELKGAGQFVPPRAKDETLAKKVEELRNEGDT